MKKKICFVVSSPITVKAFLYNHIRELSRDYDIYLVANLVNENMDTLKDIPLVEIKSIPLLRKIDIVQDTKALLMLRRYLKENNFDAVHSVTPKAGLIAMTAARLSGIKNRIHIFTGQVWHTQKGFMRALLKFMDICIAANSTCILVDGQSQREYLIQNKIIKAKDSKVLGKGSISGVDTNRFVPDDLVSQYIRKELGIEPHEIVFMFLGRLNKDKGIFDLIDAFLKLKEKYQDIRLLLIGFDEENIESITRLKYQNIDSIYFGGPTTIAEKMIQACDVFCLPSYREGFGTSVIEASLLEKPIICSDTYGLRETIINDKTGLRHEVGNVDGLYLLMETLVINKEKRMLLGKNGRQYVLDNFSGQTITNEWIKFYNKLLGDV